ncbi:MAG: beta-ketoacyl-ACP reductase [Bdellovibrionaceae bacterium]|nr:beta-ketoacyl-ACP reductase [Pseudobdellovibrionaceae bacterium]|tara:strand:- start:1377 stop:2120 length:744 start_codon:yes stop_codon:yes gene_type:complete
MKFKNRVVLVTGSSRGLGKQIATGFSIEGANVIINYSNSKDEAISLAKELSNESSKCVAVKCDVRKIEQVQDMINFTVSKFGKIDILVNNAAIYEDSTVLKMESDVWEKVIETDLNSVFYCSKFAISKMVKENYGRIINISSVVGQTGGFGSSNYSAAKAGIFGFTRSVAKEVARKNITVNAIALGFMNDGMLKRLPESIQESILKRIPVGRWGDSEELIHSVNFLASEKASYVTGQILNVNGGYYP